MNAAELRPEHLERIRLQPSQTWAAPLMRGGGYLDALLEDGDAWAVEEGERVFGVGGIVRHHAHCGEAWTLLAADAGPVMPSIHRLARACSMHRRCAGCTRTQIRTSGRRNAGCGCSGSNSRAAAGR